MVDVVHLIQPQLRLEVGKLIELVARAVLAALLLLALAGQVEQVVEMPVELMRVLAVAVLADILVLVVLVQTHTAALGARVLVVVVAAVLV
jgi:hypothetical protein